MQYTNINIAIIHANKEHHQFLPFCTPVTIQVISTSVNINPGSNITNINNIANNFLLNE